MGVLGVSYGLYVDLLYAPMDSSYFELPAKQENIKITLLLINPTKECMNHLLAISNCLLPVANVLTVLMLIVQLMMEFALTMLLILMSRWLKIKRKL